MQTHFSSPVFRGVVPDFVSHQGQLVSHIRELRKNDSEGASRSNLRGWHSSVKLHEDKDEHISWLFGNLDGFVYACIVNFMDNTEPGKLEIMTSWANINSSGSWNMPHMHLPADWSGVVYIDVPEDMAQVKGDGDLILIDPSPHGATYRRPGTVNICPDTGHVILFPGYQMHMVAPQFGNSERISVAFNYRLVAEG